IGVPPDSAVETSNGHRGLGIPTVPGNVVTIQGRESCNPVVTAGYVDVAGDQGAISTIAAGGHGSSARPGIGGGVINLGGIGGTHPVETANHIHLVSRRVACDHCPQRGGSRNGRTGRPTVSGYVVYVINIAKGRS